MHLLRNSYPNLLEIGKTRKGAIFLDIGCCSEKSWHHYSLLVRNAYILIVGTDARKLIADGYPLEQVITSDLYQGGAPFCYLGSSTVGLKHRFCPVSCRIREPRAQALQNDSRDIPDSVRPR